MSEITIREETFRGTDVVIFEHNQAEPWKLFKQAAKWLKESEATPLVASYDNSWKSGYSEALHITYEKL